MRRLSRVGRTAHLQTPICYTALSVTIDWSHSSKQAALVITLTTLLRGMYSSSVTPSIVAKKGNSIRVANTECHLLLVVGPATTASRDSLDDFAGLVLAEPQTKLFPRVLAWCQRSSSPGKGRMEPQEPQRVYCPPSLASLVHSCSRESYTH